MLDREKVKNWYKWGMWTETMVRNAVVKGKLTADDFYYITGVVFGE